MPIRINLLSEAQALEEMRRRDPVKRAIWVAAGLVVLLLVWCVSLQVSIMRNNDQLKGLEAQAKARNENYQEVLGNQKKLADIELKQVALRRLAGARFLNGNTLNALQTVTVDDVNLVHLKVIQQYNLTPETKARTNENGTIPGKPATVTESSKLVLDGKDFSQTQGERVNKLKQAIATSPYFQTVLGTNNDSNIKLVVLSQQQQDGVTGKPFRLFTFDCLFPDKTR